MRMRNSWQLTNMSFAKDFIVLIFYFFGTFVILGVFLVMKSRVKCGTKRELGLQRGWYVNISS